MKYITLAVLLTFVQANPPVPRKATDTTASHGQNVTQNTGTDKTKPEPAPPPAQIIVPAPNETNTKLVPQNDARHSVRVSELPTVSVRTGWRDDLALAFAGALVGVGAYGVWMAKRTLKAIEGQVRAQLEALRPRLTIGIKESPLQAIAEGRPAIMVAQIINTGGTPAYRIIPESWIEFMSVPFVQFTQDALYFKGDSFQVSTTVPVAYPVQLGRRFSRTELT